MQSTVDFSDILRDPLYRRGMAQLQAGKWQEAIECFESLIEQKGVSQPAQLALNEARFKARLDGSTRVRAKRWIIPWRRLGFIAGGVVLVVALVLLGSSYLTNQLMPAVAQNREARRLAQLLEDANAFLKLGRLDDAQANYEELLVNVPEHPEAISGLATIEAQRGLASLCAEAVAAYEAGEYSKAREQFTEISLRFSGACDASRYIADINSRLTIDDMLDSAEAAYAAGRYAQAAEQYEQIRERNVSYQQDLIADRLYECYVRLGMDLIETTTTPAESVPQALDYFTRALALRPRDTQASYEQRLASLYLAGQEDYTTGQWDAAASRLEAVFDRRSDYLQGALIEPLYDAYIRSGDTHREQKDYPFAWEQYNKALELNSGNDVLAKGRMATLIPLMTPTSTPTFTPTPTATGTYTPIPSATPRPTDTPRPTSTFTPTVTPTVVLSMWHDKIVFFADKEDQRGMWMMNPDGTGRRYLGNDRTLREEYDQLLAQDTLSPDGRYRVYVTRNDDGIPQLYIQATQLDQWGNADTWRVTDLPRVCYDPVWAPDGSKIAFVSQTGGSDDVWVVDPDGSDPVNYTKNDWEWDKRPSWSPDSKYIVFWSNRTGVQQIYIMNADGRNVRMLSNTTWDEYDPLWIKVR